MFYDKQHKTSIINHHQFVCRWNWSNLEVFVMNLNPVPFLDQAMSTFWILVILFMFQTLTVSGLWSWRSWGRIFCYSKSCRLSTCSGTHPHWPPPGYGGSGASGLGKNCDPFMSQITRFWDSKMNGKCQMCFNKGYASNSHSQQKRA